MITASGCLSCDKITRPELFEFLKSLTRKSKSEPTEAVGVLAFFEPSTRTRTSFEKAGLDLGIRWIHLSAADSSLQKGESFEDTFKTLMLYRPDFFVVRHASSGFAHLVHQWTGRPVVNAGDGQRDHPTQGLLDAYTLWSLDPAKKLRIAFFGDVARSRVARADIHLFRLLGYSMAVVDDGSLETEIFSKAYSVKLIKREALKSFDVVVALRVQRERGSERRLAPLSKADLGPKTYVMHPGPVILGQDLAFDLGDFSKLPLLVHRQVENGLKVRTQILRDLISWKGPA